VQPEDRATHARRWPTSGRNPAPWARWCWSWRSPRRDGKTHLVMSPREFTQRLAELVPRQRLAAVHAPCAARAARATCSRRRTQGNQYRSRVGLHRPGAQSSSWSCR